MWDYRISSHLSEHHPAAKPVDLIAELIERFTNPGDTVLDPCMGIGSTGLACVANGRNFIGLDIERKYVAIAQRRLERPHAPIPRPGKPESYPLFGDSA